MKIRWVFLLALLVYVFDWSLFPAHVKYDSVSEQDVQERTVRANESEIVVDLRDNLAESEILQMNSDYGIEMLAESHASFDPYRIMVIRLPGRSIEEQNALIDALNHDSRVEHAEVNLVYQLCGEPTTEPNDPLYKFQWHLKMIHTAEAWKYSMGENAVVAVIDTGVTHTEEAVVEDMRGVKFVHPYNFIQDKPNGNDDHGHGTHVAGTIAEVTNNNLGAAGVAPKATIMPLKVLSRYGSGTVADIAAAIRFAADKGANVINMSLGGSMPSKVMEDAVDYAYSKGVIVVCAAGNSGPRKDTVGYPAGYKNAVSVSSLDSTGNLAWYSSWGKKVEIAAPGGDTRADRNGDGYVDGVLQNTIVPNDRNNKSRYELFQGTSMASPHVAGVAALVVSLGVKDPKKILAILQDSAEKKNDRERFGAGRVDALAAVQKAKGSRGLESLLQLAPLYGMPASIIRPIQEGLR